MFYLLETDKIDRYFIQQYQFIDDFTFILSPRDVFGDTKELHDFIEALKIRFKEKGWEGDGEIGLIWLPPFLDIANDDNYGNIIWHVKQINDGISFIASEYLIMESKILDQSKEFINEYEKIIPYSMLGNTPEKLIEYLEQKTNEINELINYDDKYLQKILRYEQNEIITYLYDFIDECYLVLLQHVLLHNNKSGIKLEKENIKLDLKDISDSSFEDNDQFLTIRKIIRSIWFDFKFKPIKDRIKKIIKPIGIDYNDSNISKIIDHIILRNCIQHHRNILQKDVLDLYGKTSIIINDENNNLKTILCYSEIILNINELIIFIKSACEFIKLYNETVRDKISMRTTLHIPIRKIILDKT